MYAVTFFFSGLSVTARHSTCLLTLFSVSLWRHALYSLLLGPKPCLFDVISLSFFLLFSFFVVFRHASRGESYPSYKGTYFFMAHPL